MKVNGIILFLGFVAGCFVAWLIMPEQTQRKGDAATVAAVQDSRISSQRAKADPAATTASRLQGYIHKLTEAAGSDNKEKVKQLIDGIPNSDIPALVEAWKKCVGFTGVGEDGVQQLRMLIQKWYEQDALGALAWVSTLEPIADRRELLSAMLNIEANRGVDQALAFAKEHGSAVGAGGFEMPYSIRKKFHEFTAGRIMELLRTFRATSGNYDPIKYQEGFDFAVMGEMLLEDHIKLAETSHYTFFLSNFLTAWAESDPRAAWSHRSKIPFRDARKYGDSEHLFDFITEHSGIAVANELLVEQLASIEGDFWKINKAKESLKKRHDEQQLADFLARIPDQRAAYLEGMAWPGSVVMNHKGDAFGLALINQMTREERMQIVPKTFGRIESNRQYLGQLLEKLGHTPSEIQVMLP